MGGAGRGGPKSHVSRVGRETIEHAFTRGKMIVIAGGGSLR